MSLEFHRSNFSKIESDLFRIYNRAKDKDVEALSKILRDIANLCEELVIEVSDLKNNNTQNDESSK